MAFKINTNIVNDADGYLLDAKSVKGGYVVVSGVEEDVKENLPAATLVSGTLVYDVNEGKSYRYSGNEWVVDTAEIPIDGIFLVADNDKLTINSLYRAGYLAV